MGKTWRPKAPLEAAGVEDAEKVAVGKMWRPRPRRPAKAPLKAVGEKDTHGVALIAIDMEAGASALEAPVVAPARGREKGPLEDVTAVCLMARQEAVGVKDAAGVAVGTMWRPRRPAKEPPKAVGVKDDKGVAVITRNGLKASGLGAPMTGGRENEIAMCRIDALAEAPVITTTRQEALGVKDARGVAVEKMWRPRQPVKSPLKAVQVKGAEGVPVIAVDAKVESSVLAAPVVTAARAWEKGPLEDGTSVFLMDSLGSAPVNATKGQEVVGVKDARGVAVEKMWRRRQPVKSPLKAVQVKGAEGVPVIAVDAKVESSVLAAPVVTAARAWEKGPLEDGTSVCLMDSLDRAPVNATTGQEVVGLKDAKGVAVEKMWRRRQPVKAPLKEVRVKDAQGVAVIAVDAKVESSVLAAPVVTAARAWEKGPLEDVTSVFLMDSLDRAPVNATTGQEAVGVKDAEGVVVGKMWRPRRPAKAQLERVVVKDAKAAAVKDTGGIAVITIDRKVESSVLVSPVVVVARGVEKGPLEEGVIVCQVDTLDGAPVTSKAQQEVVGVKDAKEVAVGVEDAEGVAKITVVGEVDLLVLEDPVVAAAGGRDEGSMEDGIVVCRMDALEGAPIIATDQKEDVLVQGDPVLPAVDQKVDALVVEGMQAISVNGNGKEEKDKEGIKWLKHYSTAQSILIIGDGDFSFSLALATAFGSGWNLVATSLDSYVALKIKYDKAESNVRELKRLGATVLHGVDAETMKLHPYLEMRRFDRIVFNFPHAGFKGREHHLHVIKSHKQLVHGFFANARQLLRPYGEIHLSHKKGLTYDKWGIKKLAKKACLICVRKVDFSKDDYPGYNQKKGDGVTCDESFPLGPCCTFMFCARDEKKLKQVHRNSVGLTSSCCGDSKFYPGISATDMMWPFDLHPAWPQPHFPPVQMPIAFDPCPVGVAEMVDPFNCYGTTFHHQEMVQPTYQEQPWYQDGPFNCYGTTFHHQEMVQPTYQEQPWYQDGPPIEPPWTTPRTPESANGVRNSQATDGVPEYPYMESVERQAMFGNVDSSIWQTVT